MVLPLSTKSNAKRRDAIIAVDLGGRTTKAVYLQRKGDKLSLSSYAVMDAPIYEKSLSSEMLAEHLKALCKTLDARTKNVILVVGVNDSVVRHAEMPAMPTDDMRQVLKMNSKNYLQQDLTGYVFDCFITPPKENGTAKPDAKKPAGGVQKLRVLVGGAKGQLMNDLQEAIKGAGLVADSVMPALLGPINAFELAMPEVFAKEIVALIDIGFKNTTISILNEGDIALSRVVAIGGDKLTLALSETMSTSYAEAEGMKLGMITEVQPYLEPVIASLGRELRASIDYFEHQQDKTVAHIFVSGATSSSEVIRQLLQVELLVECKPWNPTASTEHTLPPQQLADLDNVAPQLTVAIGAAVAAF